MQINLRCACRLDNITSLSYVIGRPMHNQEKLIRLQGYLAFENAVLWNADAEQPRADSA